MSGVASSLDVRDDFLELAERYETVAALDLTPQDARDGHTPPGSRMPPGMQEVLDADEVTRALTQVDEWAGFLMHVVVDECGQTQIIADPTFTPLRLRIVAKNAGHFVEHDDELFAWSVLDDLHERLRDMRRLSGRGVRRVRTGMRCHVLGCAGQYVSRIGEGGDDALSCDSCGARIEWVTWSAWARNEDYITIAHAANLLGTTLTATRKRASRGQWERIEVDGVVKYLAADVRKAAGMVPMEA